MTYIIMNVIIGVGDVVESSFGHSIVCVKRFSIVCTPISPALRDLLMFVPLILIRWAKKETEANERKW